MPLASSMNVIFHDPRGCGRSVASQSIYTIEQVALDIVALMEHRDSDLIKGVGPLERLQILFV